MANVQTSIDIATPVQCVWELATDLEFKLSGGEVGEAAGRVLSSHAEREADASLSRLKQLAEG
jgi:hypothetical protein